MKYRLASDPDRKAIAQIHTASWQENYRAILSDDFLQHEVENLMAARWAGAAIALPNIVIVAQDEEVEGFGAAWDGESVYIDNLHVRSGLRSHGVGRALFAEIASQILANGRSKAHLHVVETNHRARELYLRLGGVAKSLEPLDIYGNITPAWRIEWSDVSILRDQAKIEISAP